MRFGALELWSVGVLECWSVGVLEHWSIGFLVYSTNLWDKIIVNLSDDSQVSYYHNNLRHHI